jgi:hypothetical protein
MSHEFTDEQFKDPNVKLGTGDIFYQDKPASMSVEEELKLLKKKKQVNRKPKQIKPDHSLQTSMFENFLSKLETKQNTKLIECIREGFKSTHPKT